MKKIKLVEMAKGKKDEVVGMVKEKKFEFEDKMFVKKIQKTETNETFVPFSLCISDPSESIILYDADVYSILNPTLAAILKDESLISSVTHFLDLVDKSIDVANNIKNIISLLKEHKFEDYKIAAVTVAKAKMLDLSRLDFIKQYIIEPYLNNRYSSEIIVNADESSVEVKAEEVSEAKADEVKESKDNSEKTSKDDKKANHSILKGKKHDKKEDEVKALENKHDKSKPEEKEAPAEKAGAEKLSKLEKRNLIKKQRKDKNNNKTTASDISNKFTEEVDVERTGNITPADLVKNINDKKNAAEKCNCGENCTCGSGNNNIINHGKIPKATVVPIHPELDINGKAELLKKHIEFNGKNKDLTLEQIDNLLRMLEGPYLKQKLTELKSTCNPEYPMMKQIDSDNPAYDFVFSAESQSGINIIVRMNSHTNEFNGIYISIGYEQKK